MGTWDPDLFFHVLDHLGMADARQGSRHLHAVPVRVRRAVEHGAWRPAITLDLGRAGISLNTAEPMPAGSPWIVEFTEHLPGQLFPIEVIHCQPLPDGNWLVGVKFAAPLGEDELNAVLG